MLKVFVDLYNKGWIYRDNYMVNWDPGSGSAISDLEVEEREAHDTLFHIAYPLSDGSGEVVVATVRPETMLADVAVAVHPDDERYKDLVGKTVTLPLVGRELPIIADEYVKTDFGTGCLKITPGHDPNDFEIGRRHGLPELSAIGEDGRMTDLVPQFAGLPVAEAQAAVVVALEEIGRDPGQGALHAHRPVQPSQRAAHRAADLAAVVHEDGRAGRAGDPGRQGRQGPDPSRVAVAPLRRLAGEHPAVVHLAPAVVGPSDPGLVPRRGDVRAGRRAPEGDGWERDPDVLDTWFSSALWPFATLGWPDETPELKAFYPTDVLSTARDILFLWVARMVMMGIEFTGEIPFSDVYIHSVIQAPDGRRMSKSLGTGIDPVDLIDAHGADGVRFGLLAMSSTQDVRFSEEKVAQGQALANKLFNATRFVVTNAAEGTAPAAAPQTVEDRWILSRLGAARDDFAARVRGLRLLQGRARVV